MLYGFVLGFGIPILLRLGHWRFPKVHQHSSPCQSLAHPSGALQARFDLWNVAIFATTMENFYGNISTFVLTKFILGESCALFLSWQPVLTPHGHHFRQHQPCVSLTGPSRLVLTIPSHVQTSTSSDASTSSGRRERGQLPWGNWTRALTVT